MLTGCGDRRRSKPMYYTKMPSPVGELLLAGSERKLRMVRFPSPGTSGAAPRSDDGWQRRDELFKEAVTQLNEYFAGRRRQFDLPLEPIATPVSNRSPERPTAHSLRRDSQLRRGRPEHRQADGRARGGCRQRAQSVADPHPLSSGDRPQWQADRVWRRLAGETVSLGLGARRTRVAIASVRRRGSYGCRPLSSPRRRSFLPRRMVCRKRRRSSGVSVAATSTKAACIRAWFAAKRRSAVSSSSRGNGSAANARSMAR